MVLMVPAHTPESASDTIKGTVVAEPIRCLALQHEQLHLYFLAFSENSLIFKSVSSAYTSVCLNIGSLIS